MAEKRSESIIQKFKLIKNIIYYVNYTKFDKYIEKQIIKFSNLDNDQQKYSAIFLPFFINCAKANDFSSDISLELIFNPLNFLLEVKKIVHRIICVLLGKTIQLNQIFVTIVPISLPVENVAISGLCSFQGVMIQHSERQKYVKCTVWACPHHDSPIFQAELSTNERCDFCGGILEEQVPYRTMGEMLICNFIDINALKINKPGQYETITVEIKDLLNDIELGSVYTLTCVKEKNYVAWNIEKHSNRPIVLKHNNIFNEFAEFREKSPWMLVYALSMFIATDYYPPTLFTNLKIGILLSLASLNEKSNPVPIFAFGSDTLIAHHLFLSAADYANRFVYWSNQNVSNQKHNEFYEANILVLSKGGVCYLGDWEKYQKEKDAFIIRSSLESNKINYEDFNLELKSTVWTYWTRSDKQKKLQQLQTLINVFGIPFNSDPHENEEELIDYILSKKITNSKLDDFVLKSEDMKQYLYSSHYTASLTNVSFSESAQKLLSDYFVASRKLRPGCLPLRALEHMTSLAEAHARLNLKSEVSCEDVVLVISLYEESIEIIFGEFDLLPIYKKNIKYVDDVDIEMARFSSWLSEFILISQT